LGSALIFGALLFAGITLRQQEDPLGNWLLLASVLPLVHAVGVFRIR